MAERMMYVTAGMAAQAFCAALLAHTKMINLSDGQQALAGCVFLVATIVYFLLWKYVRQI